MPTATRRQRLSPMKVTSSFVGNKRKIKKEKVMPPQTPSSLFAKPSTTDSSSSLALLQSWANHSHADYHNFTEEQATEIRSALLEWYAQNRRKLPWRGDPPPFDGSTSGINNNNNNSNNNNKKKKKKSNNSANTKDQPSITSFFSKSQNTKDIKNESNETATTTQQSSSLLLEQAIPITGYGVWVSEIMLQQTRVEAVIPFWCKWMNSFPTVYELAAATEDEVNAHWAGLGFYRRARYLHQGAKYVVQELDGQLPTTVQGLSKIAGIGPYTASAIASIAFGVCVPVVDGNVCRVLSRLKGIANHIKSPILKDKLGWKLAGQIVEAGTKSSPGLVNQALMELGATYCAPSGSGIDKKDPLRDYYTSTKIGMAYLEVLQDGNSNLETIHCEANATKKESCELCDANGISIVLEKLKESIVANETTIEQAARIGHSAFPTDPPKTEKREEDLAMVVLRSENERYLMVKRPKQGLLAGQWEFPNVCIRIRKGKTANHPTKAARGKVLTEFLLDDLFLDHPNEEMPAEVSTGKRLTEKEPLEHIFSHVKHYMWVEVGHVAGDIVDENLEWTTPSGKEVRWMNKDDMKKVGITSGVKKVLHFVEKKKSSHNEPKPKKRRKK